MFIFGDKVKIKGSSAKAGETGSVVAEHFGGNIEVQVGDEVIHFLDSELEKETA